MENLREHIKRINKYRAYALNVTDAELSEGGNQMINVSSEDIARITSGIDMILNRNDAEFNPRETGVLLLAQKLLTNICWHGGIAIDDKVIGCINGGTSRMEVHHVLIR
jgi:hypothetical protein